jgi:hypothetical protein
MKNKNLSNIMEALSRHQDEASVEVLERLGTNCQHEDVRMLAAKALVGRNTRESLSIAMLRQGKGINDLSTNVAMSTINELLSLKDKAAAMNLLSDLEGNLNEELRETANAVKALMAFS